MKRILLTLAALAFAFPGLAVEPEYESIDTLRSAVVTGTRVAMDRDRLPAVMQRDPAGEPFVRSAAEESRGRSTDHRGRRVNQPFHF